MILGRYPIGIAIWGALLMGAQCRPAPTNSGSSKSAATSAKTDPSESQNPDSTAQDTSGNPEPASTTETPIAEGDVKIEVNRSEDTSSTTNSTTTQTTTPTNLIFTGITLANSATDGYVNQAEYLSPMPLITLNASGYKEASFTVPLPAAGLKCNVNLTYSSTLPSISDIPGPDDTYAVCVKIVTRTNQELYAKSPVVQRDIAPPVLIGITASTEAQDGYVTELESASTSPMATVTASGYDVLEFTPYLPDLPAVTCNDSQTYGLTSVPMVSDISQTKGLYAICVRLKDLANNKTFGKTITVRRLGVRPPVPANFAITSGDSQLSLSWSAAGGTATGMVLLRATNLSNSDAISFSQYTPAHGTSFIAGSTVTVSGVASPVVVIAVGNTTSSMQTSLTNGTPHHYLLMSFDDDFQYSPPSYQQGSSRSPHQKLVGLGAITDAKIQWPDRMSARGNFLYIGNYTQGAVIVDVTNRSSPVVRGQLALAGRTRYFAAYNDTIAYAANSQSGLVAIDISNPDAPTLITSVALSNAPANIAMSGSYAYVAAQNAGLVVFDLTNPSAPSLIATAAMADAQDVRVVGQYAYVANGTSGLQIVDISDPAQPALKGSFNDNGKLSYAYGLHVANGHAYVVDYWDYKFYDINVSNVDAPTLVTARYMGDSTEAGVSSNGSYVFTSGGSNGLLKWDMVSELGFSGQAYSTNDYDRYVYDTVSLGDYVYTIEDSYVGVYQIQSVPNIPVGHLSITGQVFDVATNGSRAYLAAGNGGLAIVDLSSTNSPTLLSQLPTSYTWDQAHTVVVNGAGTRAYLGTNNSGMFVYDVSNPASPIQVGSPYTTSSNIHKIALLPTENYIAAATSWNNTVDIIDVSNPASMSRVALISLSDRTLDLVLVSNLLYIATSRGIVIYDLSTPTSPVLAGSYNIGSTTSWSYASISVSGSTAYVTSPVFGLCLLDVSVPSLITLISQTAITGMSNTHTVVVGNHLYLANSQDGVILLDQSNPATSLPEIARYTPFGSANRLTWYGGDNLLVASDLGGLSIFHIPTP